MSHRFLRKTRSEAIIFLDIRNIRSILLGELSAVSKSAGNLMLKMWIYFRSNFFSFQCVPIMCDITNNATSTWLKLIFDLLIAVELLTT